MANYCYNTSIFSGKKENLQKMYDNIIKAKQTHPEPPFEHLYYRSFFTALGWDIPKKDVDVYEDFGSKWFDCDIDWDAEEQIVISGSSAWSPVSEFFLKLSRVYELEFTSEFDEAGCDFGGFYSGINGEVTDNRTYTHAQYEWLSKDFESIDLDYHEFESEEEAIEFFSSIQEVCTRKEWEVVLKIISETFKEKL
jgi:hypothetical protein